MMLNCIVSECFDRANIIYNGQSLCWSHYTEINTEYAGKL